MRFLTLIISSFFLCLTVFAQKRSSNPQPVFVTGKVLSYSDSMRVKQMFYAALKDKTIGNSVEAINKFKIVLGIDPANDAAMYEIGYYNHNQGNEAGAEAMARNAVTVSPDNKWYWLLLADIYKKTSNLEQLTLVFDELIRLSPDDEDYYYDKANALFLQKKVDAAEKAYNEIQKRFGDSEDLAAARRKLLYQQGKPVQIISELEKQIKDNPSDIKLYVTLAGFYAKSNDNKKAAEVLEKAKKIDPANALVRLGLADIYRNENNFDKAFIELKAAFADPNLSADEKVKIVISFFPLFSDAKARGQAEELALIATKTHPQDAKVFSVYGDVLYQQRKLDAAVMAYRSALKLDEQVYQIWEQLVRVELEKADYKSAIDAGNEAITVFPNQPPLYLYTSMAYVQEKNPAQAVILLNDAAKLNSQDLEVQSQIYSTLGDAYHSLNKISESDAAYEKSIKVNPDNVYSLNNYAYYLSLRGEKLEQAEKMSKRSNELDVNNSAFEDTYAWVLFKLKKYKEARVWMEKAIADDKNTSSGKLEHYGDILFHLNEVNAAVEQWKKAKAAGLKSDILDKKINEKKYVD